MRVGILQIKHIDSDLCVSKTVNFEIRKYGKGNGSMDKKCKRILNKYMENEMNYREQYNVSPEEISYAKDQGAILEDLFITNEEAICLLS